LVSFEPIQDARERRPFVAERAVHLTDRTFARGFQVREHVCFGLVHGRIAESGDVERDPMRGAMNVGNEAERHEKG
jgi:hypothetical protein